MDISFDEKTAFFSKENNHIYEKGPVKNIGIYFFTM